MRLKFIDVPQPADRQDYEDAIETISGNLVKTGSVRCVIRFGNITTPGISDIDLMAVFKDDSFCPDDPLNALPYKQRKLFTHNVDAVPEKYFYDLVKYS